MDLITEKRQLRKIFLKKRKSLTTSYRKQANKVICQYLKTIEGENHIELLAAYMSDGFEPDLQDYLQWRLAQKKRCLLPRKIKSEKQQTATKLTNAKGEYELVEVRNLESDLISGAYGLLEPVDILLPISSDSYKQVTWLIPGVVFDAQGRRLGRGKGIYDQLLAETCGLRIGIFFQCQQHCSVPTVEHDQPLDFVITEKGIQRIPHESSNKIK